MSLQRVSAILVVHDGATWLPEVVASLASQTRAIDYLVAVDTGSQDNSAALLKGARIPIVAMARDTGFGSAVASAVEKLAPASTQEWLWILHDDCAPAPHALESLLNAIEQRPNIVMAGPKLLGWHDRTHLLEIGVSIATNGARWTGLEESEYDQGQHDGTHDVLAVSTAGALIRRDVFEELGGFDKNLELFRDDVDFGWRVHAAGHGVIIVTDAIAYHAEASASERREVDVKGALLHRPLLLDRQNAAYVLLVNATWWLLPLLSIQLFGSALLRSIGFLFAKLPGYASDELLAIGSLLVKPGEIVRGRKVRKATRLVSSRVVSAFIPSRAKQFRLAIANSTAALRDFILKPRENVTAPEMPAEPLTEADFENEDLLTPVATRNWISIFKRPFVISFIFLTILTILWSRNRFGAVSGATLAPSPSGASDLWQFYFQPWHEVGLGSKSAAPLWAPIIAITSILFFGNVAITISLFFIVAPLLIFTSSHLVLKKYSENRFLTSSAALLYSLSPIAISAINTGRLGVLVTLIFLPFLLHLTLDWRQIESFTIRKIAAISLFLALLFVFAPQIFLALIGLTIAAIASDYFEFRTDSDTARFKKRLFRRFTLLLSPLAITIPWSLEEVTNPSNILLDLGLLSGGGGSNLALLANPGGVGSLPWWLVSPISLILLVAAFSTTKARNIAATGGVFLLVASLTANFATTGRGTNTPSIIYPGIFLAIATLAATLSAVIVLDRVRESLRNTHLNYRHFTSAALVIACALYGGASTAWIVSQAPSAPLQSARGEVLPPFLAIESDSKVLVLRERVSATASSLNYYIARGGDLSLGDADVAGDVVGDIALAVTGLVDGSGITSSKTLASFGISYIFLKAPTQGSLIQTIDGLGGFARASATSAGTVWKVVGATGNLIITDISGKSAQLIPTSKANEYSLPYPGVITLTESYSRSWQLLQNGTRLVRIKSELTLPQFAVTTANPVILLYDGSIRRGWISLNFIALLTFTLFALPSGRRKSEISEKELA
jgi:GT2 family glycosyltransferase